MTALTEEAQAALDAFTTANGWEARSRLLLQWATRLPDVETRRDEDLVHGCESQVWVTHQRDGNRNQFRAGSDSRILRGLLAVLLARANGLTDEELADLNVHDWLHQLGLERQLSASRGNGLRAVVERMKALSAI
ncbi:cysteine desulfuration protein SufE [Pseudomonas duriflava]|uniref:Cysteine desulfuration protein SufE n=1 Tax=Pseudomonas duriflava TaxID=459528 RepID=A0A562QFD5_9PSED|nr:SufE family protein [Pseudomonas duriflava]TWI55472.1 cysteine desulfuration protein SufE [Pseudomonas duriflava]